MFDHMFSAEETLLADGQGLGDRQTVLCIDLGASY